MKFLKFAGITTIVVIALAVLGVTLAFAQQPSPQDTPSWWDAMKNMMQGSGMMGNGAIGNGAIGNGGRGMMGGRGQSMLEMHRLMTQNGGMGAMHQWMHQSGGVHETVWNALAAQLGLTPDELTAQIYDGKTLAQIAEEQGVSTQDLAAVMESTMKTGLTQAVEDGLLTQEQADLMLQQMEGQYEWMINNMGAGMMGPGSGWMNPGSGGCHNRNRTTDEDISL